MKFEFELTLADYKAALALHYRCNLLGRISRLFVFVIIPGVAVAVLLFQVFLAFTQGDYFRRNPPVGLIPLVVFALLPLLYRYSVRKQFNRIFPKRWRDRRVLIDVDEERLISAIPGASEGKFYWNSILKYSQDEKITLFYVAKNRFLFMPTQVVSRSDREELKDLIARCLDAKAAC